MKRPLKKRVTYDPKPASKYHALAWLINLTRENYQGKSGAEYNETEVNDMIIVKQMKKAAELCKAAAKRTSSTSARPLYCPTFKLYS